MAELLQDVRQPFERLAVLTSCFAVEFAPTARSAEYRSSCFHNADISEFCVLL